MLFFFPQLYFVLFRSIFNVWIRNLCWRKIKSERARKESKKWRNSYTTYVRSFFFVVLHCFNGCFVFSVWLRIKRRIKSGRKHRRRRSRFDIRSAVVVVVAVVVTRRKTLPTNYYRTCCAPNRNHWLRFGFLHRFAKWFCERFFFSLFICFSFLFGSSAFAFYWKCLLHSCYYSDFSTVIFRVLGIMFYFVFLFSRSVYSGIQLYNCARLQWGRSLKNEMKWLFNYQPQQ